MVKIKKLFCIVSSENKVIGVYRFLSSAERDCFYLNTHLKGSYFIQPVPFGHDAVCDNWCSVESCHLRNKLDI